MTMEPLKVGSLGNERLLLRAVIPGLLLLIILPLCMVSAVRNSLPWITHARLAAICGLGALVSYLLSRRLPGFRFEIAAGELQVASGVLRKHYPMSRIAGPVRLTASRIPVLSFQVGRVRHWYSVGDLNVQERKDLFMQLSAAAANNAQQPTREDARA